MTPAIATAYLLAGATSALSPCAAPRMLAVVSLSRSAPARAVAFLAGLFVSYFIIGFAAQGLQAAALLQIIDERVLAAVFVVTGIIALRPQAHCAHDSAHGRGGGAGLSFAAGLSMGCLAVPCCAPLFIILLGSVPTGTGAVALAVMAFAVGQLLPIAVTALAGSAIIRRVASGGSREIISVTTAIFSLMIGTYYALLGF